MKNAGPVFLFLRKSFRNVFLPLSLGREVSVLRIGLRSTGRVLAGKLFEKIWTFLAPLDSPPGTATKVYLQSPQSLWLHSVLFLVRTKNKEWCLTSDPWKASSIINCRTLAYHSAKEKVREKAIAIEYLQGFKVLFYRISKYY